MSHEALDAVARELAILPQDVPSAPAATSTTRRVRYARARPKAFVWEKPNKKAEKPKDVTEFRKIATEEAERHANFYGIKAHYDVYTDPGKVGDVSPRARYDDSASCTTHSCKGRSGTEEYKSARET